MLRWLFQELLLIPGYRLFMGLTVRGRSNLSSLSPPVIFAANHTSHLDTLSILDALPSSWRRRLAPSMMLEYFTPLIQPDRFGLFRRLTARIKLLLLSHLLNAYPLPQRMGGVRRVLRFSGLLAEQGYCPLVYPEGTRTKDGQIQAFQPGVGLMAKQLDLPVVPIRLQGLFELFSVHHSRPHPGQVQVTFGQPVFPSPEMSPPELSSMLESRIRYLGPSEPGKLSDP
jgi:long-chain acyl-CoA synthetase